VIPKENTSDLIFLSPISEKRLGFVFLQSIKGLSIKIIPIISFKNMQGGECLLK
jgi:hypothetical protein